MDAIAMPPKRSVVLGWAVAVEGGGLMLGPVYLVEDA
jgi:hypothetical protein